MKPYRPLHLSASQIVQYLSCPASFYWSRVQNIILPANAAMLFGSAVHFGLEAFHRGANPYAAFATRWLFYRKQLEEAGMAYSEGYSTVGPALLSLYEDDPLPDGEPEVPWVVRLSGVPVPIRGVFDLAGDGWVGEHKTSGWSWGEGRIEEHFQGALYRVCYPLVAQQPLNSLTFTILSCNPQPKLVRQKLPSADAALEQKIIDTCTTVLASMAAGVWTPRCAPDACRYPAPELCPLLRAQKESL